MLWLLLIVIAVGLSFVIFPDAWSKLRASAVTRRPEQVSLYRGGQRVWGIILTALGVAGLVAWLIWGGSLT